MAQDTWPEGIEVVQMRIARPTARFDEVVASYRDALGLPVLGSFTGHAGYSAVFLGLPGRQCHLSILQRPDYAAGPAPTGDNLLVLYIPSREHLARMQTRLAAHGHRPVEPDNPYWRDKGLTYADPDGWRIVLCGTNGI